MDDVSVFQSFKAKISEWLFGKSLYIAGDQGDVRLTAEARNLYSLLNPSLAPDKGLVIQFIGSNQGVGVSTIAREFALVASQYAAAPTLLLDFDWGSGQQLRFFQQPVQLQQYGVPHAVQDGMIDSTVLIRSSNPEESCQLQFSRLGGTHLVIGQLNCRDPEAIHISNVLAFWDTVRGSYAITVVDTLYPSRSFDGLTICGSMDAVIVVVEAEHTRAHVVQDVCNKLRAQGAPIIGLVLNKRRFYIPQRVYRWMERL